MSHPRWITSLLALAIFFANACCLAHQAPQQLATSSKHACCKKHTEEKQVPAKSCECCKRIVASVDSSPTHSHAALLPVWNVIASCDASIIASPLPVSTLHFDSTAPPSA